MALFIIPSSRFGLDKGLTSGQVGIFERGHVCRIFLQGGG